MDDNTKFCWRQIIHTIPRAWKEMSLNQKADLLFKKINIREVYNMHFTLSVEKPTAQIYFEKNFQNLQIKWKDSV